MWEKISLYYLLEHSRLPDQGSGVSNPAALRGSAAGLGDDRSLGVLGAPNRSQNTIIQSNNYLDA